MSEPKKPAKPADVDERNLVEVGPEFAEATVEDKVFLWWIDNKGKVIGGIIAVLVAIGGYQTYEVIKANKEVNLRMAAGDAMQDPAKLSAFAKENAGTVQAAAASMILAERQYKAREYNAALESYRAAAAVYSQVKFNGYTLGRAELGAGLAQYALNPSEGEAALRALADNQAVLTSTRAEATYKLAVIAFEKKDWETTRRLINSLESMGDTGAMLQLQALEMEDELPPVPKVELLKAPAPAAK